MKTNTKGSKTYDVYRIIKRKIITLELRPGQALSERDLIQELKAGRTPLREAILMLKSEGLLESRPNESPYVKDITLKGVKDFFLPYLTLEKLVIRLAAQKMTSTLLKEIKSINAEIDKATKEKDSWNIMSKDRQLHSMIGRATDNEYVMQIHEALLNQKERLSYLAVSEEVQNGLPLQNHLEVSSRQHMEIISLLERNDVENAETLAEEHVMSFQQRISMYISNPLM